MIGLRYAEYGGVKHALLPREIPSIAPDMIGELDEADIGTDILGLPK